MTELTAFLTSLYDSFSEAEMQALRHSQMRLVELLESGTVPDDVAVPVYHAKEVTVRLDAGLVAEQTDSGMAVFVTEKADADASELSFTVDLFDLVEREDLAKPIDDRKTGSSSRDESAGAVPDRSIANESIDVVESIDPEYREALRSLGIDRLTDIIDRSPYALADAVESEGLDVSPEQTADWLDEARGLVAMLSEREGALPVELVDGIGPVFGKRLREAGIEALPTLVDRTPDEIAEAVSSESAHVSAERAADWIEEATRKLEALEHVETARAESGDDDADGQEDDA